MDCSPTGFLSCFALTFSASPSGIHPFPLGHSPLPPLGEGRDGGRVWQVVWVTPGWPPPSPSPKGGGNRGGRGESFPLWLPPLPPLGEGRDGGRVWQVVWATPGCPPPSPSPSGGGNAFSLSRLRERVRVRVLLPLLVAPTLTLPQRGRE